MAFAVTAGTTSGGATTSPLAVSTPASVASGDLLIAVFESGGSSTTPSVTATGWTALFTSRNQVAATGNTQMHALARISDGTEGASQSFTLSTGTINHWSGRMFRVTGHGVTTIGTDIVVGATTGGAASGSSPQTVSGIGGITVTAASAIFILGTTALDANSTAQFSGWTNTDPNSFTEVADNVVLTGNGGGFGLAWGTSTGTTTGTAGFVEATNEAWNGVQFGVKPAGATQFNQSLVLSATYSTAQIYQTNKLLALGATYAVVLATQVVHVFQQALVLGMTLAAALARQTGKTLALGGTFSAALARQTNKLLSIGVAYGLLLVKQAGKALVVAATYTVAITKQVGKMLALGASYSAFLAKRIAKGLAAALVETVSLATQFIAGGGTTFPKALVLGASFTAALAKRTNKMMALTSSFTAFMGAVFHAGSGGQPVLDPQAQLIGSIGNVGLTASTGEARLISNQGEAILGP